LSGSNALKRSQHLAIRCAKLRAEGLTLSEIAKLVGVEKDKVNTRIELGKRLLSLGE
jgi:DNA-directed RNA polymerase specialized sigma24 family protein